MKTRRYFKRKTMRKKTHKRATHKRVRFTVRRRGGGTDRRNKQLAKINLAREEKKRKEEANAIEALDSLENFLNENESESATVKRINRIGVPNIDSGNKKIKGKNIVGKPIVSPKKGIRERFRAWRMRRKTKKNIKPSSLFPEKGSVHSNPLYKSVEENLLLNTTAKQNLIKELGKSNETQSNTRKPVPPKYPSEHKSASLPRNSLPIELQKKYGMLPGDIRYKASVEGNKNYDLLEEHLKKQRNYNTAEHEQIGEDEKHYRYLDSDVITDEEAGIFRNSRM
jgi:hypothetical protein